MKDSKQLIDNVAQEISRSPNSSATAAGPTDGHSSRPAPSAELIDAINQIFGLFRINYGNLYYASFKNEELEIQAKRLWLESLRQFSSETLLQAAKSVITRSDYVPTIKAMLDHCERVAGAALPDAHSAYVEACRAPSPKANASWSHPVVYHAGRACDWYFLANNSEATALPVFKRHYVALCERVRAGEELPSPITIALPEHSETALSKDDNLSKLQQLRKQLDL